MSNTQHTPTPLSYLQLSDAARPLGASGDDLVVQHGNAPPPDNADVETIRTSLNQFDALDKHLKLNCKVEESILALDRIAKRLVSQSEGWRIVPVEPSKTSIELGVQALSESGYGAMDCDAYACYKAMLSAAPQKKESKP